MCVCVCTIQSGSHYLDVNSSNKDGLTPLLLVTKDVSLFSEGIIASVILQSVRFQTTQSCMSFHATERYMCHTSVS